MEYTVKALAELAGVTPRTLRWYDREGLLSPTRRTDAGYRLYGPSEVDRLQHILFYRELGLELTAIRAILDDPAFDRQAALQSHLTELEARRQRLDSLILTLTKTLKGADTMSDKEKFVGFKEQLIRENEVKYGAEARSRYGDQAIDASNAKLAEMTEEEYQTMTAREQKLRDKLEDAVRSGADPAGAAGLEIATAHRAWLSCTWPAGQYSPDAHRGLAVLYTEDPRFTGYYDKAAAGCAAFLRAAIEAHI